MLIGSIYGWETGQEPMRVLRDYARSRGIELHTEDVVSRQNLQPDFSLYVESIPLHSHDVACNNYLIRYETPLTVPLNQEFDYLNRFDGIFTWDLDLLEGKSHPEALQRIAKQKLTEIRIPNPRPKNGLIGEIESIPSYIERPIFCCLIASNRHANLPDKRELYSERAKAIRWFEKNHPQDFRLYGNGWRVPEKRFGKLGKWRYRLEKIVPFILGRPVFKSYQGATETKQAVLLQSKFCVCFENARNIRGYLTEKIFDCLFAGCIPIYWGEPDVAKWIPRECFIDFRDFASYEDLYQFISQISLEQFKKYQIAGQDFLKSKHFYIHSSQAFAVNIIDRIANDFGLSQ